MGEIIMPVKMTLGNLTQEQELNSMCDEVISLIKEYDDALEVLDNMYGQNYDRLFGFTKEPQDDKLDALTVARVCIENERGRKLKVLLDGMRELISEVKKV